MYLPQLNGATFPAGSNTSMRVPMCMWCPLRTRRISFIAVLAVHSATAAAPTVYIHINITGQTGVSATGAETMIWAVISPKSIVAGAW